MHLHADLGLHVSYFRFLSFEFGVQGLFAPPTFVSAPSDHRAQWGPPEKTSSMHLARKGNEIRSLEAAVCSRRHNRMRQVHIQSALSHRSTARVPIPGCAARWLYGRPTGGASNRRDTCLIGEGSSVRLVDRAEVWHPTDL